MTDANMAAIVASVGAAYQTQYGERMTPVQHQALRAIQQCRTAVLGGHVYHCLNCETTQYQYHSCRNRHCPQCQHQAGEAWLQRQHAQLLPTHHFMLTFTLPAALRSVALAHQKQLYTLLFRCAAQATQKLARDERHIGGQIGMIGVLHTWGRNLSYHPHIHFLVPGGGLRGDGTWHATSHNFFLPVKALSKLFRAKMRDALCKTELFQSIPAATWQQDWVVHCQPVGHGQHAFKYLAPYVFRVAISNRRIVKFEADKVTFRYRKTETGQWRTSSLAAIEFLRRFMQHILPKGFVKVRYYGLFAPGNRARLAQCRQQLPAAPSKEAVGETSTTSDSDWPLCTICGAALRLVQRVRPRPKHPP